jgi:Transmembrane family 220, helix
MNYRYWIGAAVFALFAYWQFNDPDPHLWVPLYGGVSVLFALAALKRSYRPAIWLWMLVCAGWAATLLPDFVHWLQMGMPSIVETMKAEKPWVELTREFLGLLVAAAGCAFLLREQ